MVETVDSNWAREEDTEEASLDYKDGEGMDLERLARPS
jgi:hypothetical protein